jgi:hypothetical protein
MAKPKKLIFNWFMAFLPLSGGIVLSIKKRVSPRCVDRQQAM